MEESTQNSIDRFAVSKIMEPTIFLVKDFSRFQQNQQAPQQKKLNTFNLGINISLWDFKTWKGDGILWKLWEALPVKHSKGQI